MGVFCSALRGNCTASKELGVHPPATNFSSLPFDVVMNTPRGDFHGLDASVSLGGLEHSLHTMREDIMSEQLPTDPTTNSVTFSAAPSTSFTNSFNDVNHDALMRFMKSIATIADRGGANIIEEELRISPRRRLSEFASVQHLSAEDEAYINDGVDLEEMYSRLFEVEEVLRRQIDGFWRINVTLLGLAAAHVVPTLRQRRQAWNRPHDGQAAAPPHRGKQRTGKRKGAPLAVKKPVLVIHSLGVEPERSGFVPPSPEAAMFSPAEGPDTSLSLVSTPTNFSRSVSSRMRTDAAGYHVAHYEILALNCRHLGVGTVHAKVEYDTWDFLSKDELVSALNTGDCVFRFLCCPVRQMTPESLDQMALFINVSSFTDEEQENNVPRIDVTDTEGLSRFIGIQVKAMYMLPGVKLSSISAATVSSTEYQRACQPSANKVEDGVEKNTFRVHLSVIRFVFSLTVQFKVFEINDSHTLATFKGADGIIPAKVLILERTKRHIGKTDTTAKVKSVLCYYPVNGGLLVNNHTFVLNTSLPNVVAKLMNTFGSQGAAHTAETTELTRKYLLKRYGDCRAEET